jgi:integrase
LVEPGAFEETGSRRTREDSCVTAYRDEGQWRWRRQIRVLGEKKRGSGTPAINTKRAALVAEHDWVEAQLSGRVAPKECPTLGAVCESYLKHVKAHNSEGLKDAKTSLIRKHLKPAFGRTRLDRIDVLAIDRYKEAKLEARKPNGEPYAPGSINQQLLCLSNLLRWAKERGWVRDLPKVEILPPSEDEVEGELEFLTDEELQALLARVTGQLRTMMLFAAHTGLRIGELLALRWTDLDLKRSLVTVRRGTYRGKDRTTKGKKKRDVPISATALAAIKEHRHLRGPLVFCGLAGERLVYATVRNHARAAGLAGWHGWHVLRHTFGTMLSARGVPLRAIQEWMGHRSIKTTMIYASYSPVFADAISVLDGKAWQPGANGGILGTKDGEKSGG